MEWRHAAGQSRKGRGCTEARGSETRESPCGFSIKASRSGGQHAIEHLPEKRMSGEPVTTDGVEPEAAGGGVSEEQVKLALRRVKDPDLHLNIVDLGLLYGIRVDGSTVNVDMTLTSPACPSGPEIVSSVEREVGAIDGVEAVKTNIVWTPFWTPDRIEPRVRAYLGL